MGNLFESVAPYLDFLDNWIADWEPFLKDGDKRTLFKDISKYMRDFGKRNDAFLYLKRYHSLWQGSKPKELETPEVQEATVQLIKDAVQLPAIIQFDDIIGFDTVKAL